MTSKPSDAAGAPAPRGEPPALPARFVARMEDLLGGDAAELTAALAHAPDTGLRVNTRKCDPQRFPSLVPWTLEPVPWCPSGFVVDPTEDRPGLHPLHLAGVFYLQDPAAMAVPEALGAQPGDRVADLAAAPGGKATRIAEQIGREGFLLANDVHPERVVALGRNLERWGADNAMLVRSSVTDLADAWGPAFDRVLLDAPCSGEGMFRKSDAARAMWSEATVAACAARQGDLLHPAAAMVAPGGVLVYSTCTFAPEENEAVVAAFLRARPDFAVEALELPGVAPGRPDWVDGGAPAALAGAARLWPHAQRGEGHFVARMRRSAAGAPSPAGRGAARTGPAAEPQGSARRHVSTERRRGRAGVGLTPAEREAVEAFCAEALAGNPYAARSWLRVGDDVYALPRGAPAAPAAGAIRPGLKLGTLARHRFEPSHALALALHPHEAQRRIDLPVASADLGAYLTGLELEAPGPDGWALVCAGGFGLGWGRRVRGVVRNRYPKGLRLR